MKLFIIDLKRILFTFIVFSFIFLFVFFANENLNTVNKVINLYLYSVLPALFLFILFTEIFINFELGDKFSKLLICIINKIFKTNCNSAIVVIFGFLFGYPNAAKYISYLYKEEKITQKEAKRLCLFSNNANISYIVLSIGIGILKSIKLGYILLFSHFLSSLIIGYISRFFSTNNIIQYNNEISNHHNIYFDKFELFKKSIKNTCITLMYIFSYMILFSIIPNFLLNLITSVNIPIPNILKALIIGIFEITSGIYEISLLNISLDIKLCLISFILSFSSLMIVFQIFTYINNCKIRLTKLILYKFIHGILSMLITYIVLKLSKVEIITIISNTENFIASQTSYFLNYLILYIIFIILLFMLLYKLLKNGKRLYSSRIKGGYSDS